MLTLNSRQMAIVRNHPHTQAVKDTGWLLLADRNMCGNRIFIVSEHRDIAVTFEHEEPYADHMRSYIKATEYAKENPEKSEAGVDGLEIVHLQFAAA
ncbi:quinolinate synthase A [Novimethylophilus kurashikiensis]|uniref:Quinolinate synthase A n=1 Tax=Novimethylophilus kurashikiensis TaxID=1825523 RepID=A0A2R5FD40_9PROT|nr:hypothetical protein [Novimethylophilus kurashikiensis]GBG14823.1 quinolinate synthase A [Novimethylophilus kurashikiensis]